MTTYLCPRNILNNSHLGIISTTTTPLLFNGPFFRDHPGEPVPEENFWSLRCKGRLTKANTPTIRLGSTPSGLTSDHLHHPPFLQAGCPSCRPTNSVKASTLRHHICIKNHYYSFQHVKCIISHCIIQRHMITSNNARTTILQCSEEYWHKGKSSTGLILASSTPGIAAYMLTLQQQYPNSIKALEEYNQRIRKTVSHDFFWLWTVIWVSFSDGWAMGRASSSLQAYATHPRGFCSDEVEEKNKRYEQQLGLVVACWSWSTKLLYAGPG